MVERYIYLGKMREGGGAGGGGGRVEQGMRDCMGSNADSHMITSA